MVSRWWVFQPISVRSIWCFRTIRCSPHFNVADNVGYGLRQTKPVPSKKEIARKVDETLELVRLDGYGNRRIWELSGGQQQRVALARALINRPTVLLLDEPLAALDRQLRQEMQIELQTLQRDVGITFLLVTHDQEEALSMSDTICIMLDGRIVQIGAPHELYDDPINHYVAGFIGKSNFFKGIVVESDKTRATINLGNGKAYGGRIPNKATFPASGSEARLAVRPELINITSPDNKAKSLTDVNVSARVKNRIFLGEQTEYLVEARELGEILVRASKQIEGNRGDFSPGDAVNVGWNNESALAFENNIDWDRSTVGAVSNIYIDGNNTGEERHDQET